MKNLILILITTFTLSCCSKDDNKTPLEQLPPATTTGANTAGCLVDGRAFLPKGYILPSNLFCNYIDGKDFSLGIKQNNGNKMLSISIISYNQRLVVGETYQLKEYSANSKFGTYIIYDDQNLSEIQYKTTSTITGELKITYHNFDKAILSGTFWFDAINSKGEKIQVREGRFDMQY